MTTFLVVVLRLVVGGTFLLAGLLKVRDPAAFAVEIANYQVMPWVAPYVAITLPCFEIAIGLAALASPSRWCRAGAAWAAILMAAFTVLVTQAAGRGIDIQCGCFGGTERVGWTTVLRDLLLLAASCALFMLVSPRAPLNALLDADLPLLPRDNGLPEARSDL
jgi:hypothetical protein